MVFTLMLFRVWGAVAAVIFGGVFLENSSLYCGHMDDMNYGWEAPE